jgi:hypothetical protein
MPETRKARARMEEGVSKIGPGLPATGNESGRALALLRRRRASRESRKARYGRAAGWYAETVRVLAALQPLHVTRAQPVFTTTAGQPIEPQAFPSRYWSSCGVVNEDARRTPDSTACISLIAVQRVSPLPGWRQRARSERLSTLRRGERRR